jgi:PAS domain S-box-containing protein
MPMQQQRVEDILETISDAFVALDRDWRYVYVNRRAGEMFGRRPEDLIGKHIWTEFPEGVGQTFYHAYHRALEQDVFIHFEDYYPPWDRWFENRIYPTAGGLTIFFQDVTERKQAELALAEEASRRADTEAELRRSEARLRGIIDGASASVFVKDLEGRYVLVNRAVEQLVGRDHTEIEGRVAAEIFPGSEAAISDAEQRVREQGAEIATEEHARIDGELRTYDVRRFPLHDERGELTGIGGIATDITERAATEAALRERERQLAEAQRVAHVGSFEWDMVANRITWSEELYRIYGLDPAAFGATFETFIERVHHEDRGRIVEAIDRAVSSGAPFRMQERVVRPTGEIRHLSTWGEILRDDTGAPMRLVGICHDVTDAHRQRERAEALRDANDALTGSLDLDRVLEALLDSLVRFVPDVRARILLSNGDGGLEVRAARGYDGAAAEADPHSPDAFPVDLGTQCVREGRTIIVDDTTGRPDCRPLDEAGSAGSWIGVPLRAAGEVIGLCAIESVRPHAFTQEDVDWAEALIAQAAVAVQNARLHDELRRHAAGLERGVAIRTAELRDAKEEAERANRAKSDFLAGISHELRTPMNAILGFAQLLELDVPEGEARDNVQQILRAGHHLLQLITELLDIARIESGELALSLEPVEVAEIVQEAVDLTRPLADETGVAVAVTGDVSGYVLGDRQRVLQVLLNLLSNAVKYNRPGGTVGISGSRDATDGFALAVRDSGPGIAPEDVERLFVPFDRLGLEAGIVEGAGLGLALARRLVEVMGGSLSVDSTPGVGSIFTIVLPEAEDPLSALRVEAPQGPTADLRSATVLYVEDNLANLRLVERVLGRQPGVKVLAATQGRLGVGLAQRHHPDLVLLDLHLPDITGEEVLDELRALPETAGVPVVVISAAASKARVDALKERGIEAYLTKPIDLAELLEVVGHALGDRAG